MDCKIRKWKLTDAGDLAAALSNKKILDNLRDGLPYPYAEQDARDYISAMLSVDENETFAFAITVDGRAVGSIGVFRHIIRIYAEPFGYNAASCRVLEKVGFQYEGTLRSNAVKNGQVVDMKMYALIKGEHDGSSQIA